MNPHSVSQAVKFINSTKESSQDCVNAYRLMEEFHRISLTFDASLHNLAMVETLNPSVYRDCVRMPHLDLRCLWIYPSVATRKCSAQIAIMPCRGQN